MTRALGGVWAAASSRPVACLPTWYHLRANKAHSWPSPTGPPPKVQQLHNRHFAADHCAHCWSRKPGELGPRTLGPAHQVVLCENRPAVSSLHLCLLSHLSFHTNLNSPRLSSSPLRDPARLPVHSSGSCRVLDRITIRSFLYRLLSAPSSTLTSLGQPCTPPPSRPSTQVLRSALDQRSTCWVFI